VQPFLVRADAVKCRIANKTYGAGIMRWYNENKHEEKRKLTFNGREWCDGVFEPFVLKCQPVNNGHVISKRRTPVEKYQKEMMIDIYCTDKTDFEEDDYVDKPYMQRLAHVLVEMPDVEKEFDRAIIVDFRFGGTEIKITARDQFSDEIKVQTKISFCQ
jgi:hypothetical protein